MPVIHKREQPKHNGGAIYLNPYRSGQAIYLNPRTGGTLGIGGIFRALSDIGRHGINFANNNKELIKSGIEAGSNIASAVSNIKKAADEAEKLKLIRNLNRDKNTKKKEELSDEDKKLIDEAINGIKRGSGLKRF